MATKLVNKRAIPEVDLHEADNPNARLRRAKASGKVDPHDLACLGTPEEIARDNAEWDEIIANTTPEKIALLKRMYEDEIKRGEVLPRTWHENGK